MEVSCTQLFSCSLVRKIQCCTQQQEQEHSPALRALRLQEQIVVRECDIGRREEKEPHRCGSHRCFKSAHATKADRWSGLGKDTSDDQQDIQYGKGMVDAPFEGATGMGTQNAVMSSYDYISTAQRNYNFDNKTSDGLYIAPALIDKLVVHVAKSFMNLTRIKIPLILGIWGHKGQGKSFQSELVMKKLGIKS